MAYIIFFLPLLPSLIGSYMVEPAYQPFGVLGTTIGSLLFVFIWDQVNTYFIYPRCLDIYLLLVGEIDPETYLNYFLVGLIGGVLGWIVRAWKEKRMLSLNSSNNTTKLFPA